MAVRHLPGYAAFAGLLAGGVLLATAAGGDAPPPPPKAPTALGPRITDWTWSGRAVTVPYAPRAPYFGSAGWFRATLHPGRPGRYELRFGSVNYAATVWVGGRRVCSHAGAYVPFACPFRSAAGAPVRMKMRVDWRDPARMKRESFDRAWFNWGGIEWPVRLARLGPSELAAPRVRTRLAGGTARVEVAVVVRNRAAARALRPVGELRRGGQVVALRFPARRVAHDGHAVAVAHVVLPAPQLWSPTHPALYRLSLSVPGETHLSVRVGLRTIGRSGGRLLLNGRPLLLRGASLPPDAGAHGDAFTAGDERRIVAELRALGANATRAQFPLSDGLLDRLDAAGILVWQEVGPFDPAGAFRAGTPHLVARAKRRALTTALRERRHPSVLAWSLANEVAGQGNPAGQAAYVDRTADALHRLDPGRLVGADVWLPHPPHWAGPLYQRLDAIGFTDYTGWYEDTSLSPAAQEATVAARVAGLRALFPDRVLVATEFGAAGNDRAARAAAGGLGFQGGLIARRIRTYGSLRELSGALVFGLRDYLLHPGFRGGTAAALHPGGRFADTLNEKGLFRRDGSAKPALDAARAAFAATRRQGR
jgi:hypothetical protein